MSTPVIRRLLAVAGLGVLSMVLWITLAGPTVVGRILRYNVSDIDDYRIFPSRHMSAAATPFRFRPPSTAASAFPAALSAGRLRDVSVADFMTRTDTVALLVLRGDEVLYEGYRDGLSAATPSMAFSVSKSILSILVGCALADGHLSSVDQPVTDFVPELRHRGFDAVTLQHLLQMTSGIDYTESDNPFGRHARFYYTAGLERDILSLRLHDVPGRRFVYKSADAYLLTLALQRALGTRRITDYMTERLWHPLGMENDGGWSVDTPAGLEKTACCLTLTARDLAKFGRLYLQGGMWQGRRIVPEPWIRTSTRADRAAAGGEGYRNLWWLVAPDRPDYFASGHLGQFLYVNPAADVVIVRFGRSLGGLRREDWIRFFVTLSGRLAPGRATSAVHPPSHSP